MSEARPFTIRRARPADAAAVGRLGALLLQTHYAFDPQRFLAPGDSPEEGYAWFLRNQLRHPDVVVFVAELRETADVVGYVYAGLEPMSWKELRDAAGFVHDVAVDPSARRMGIAAALIEEAAAWLKARGAPRVLLWTAEPNADAQRLFTRLGFRRTMVEMTREL
jgi:ribosomal protein S18 acetylase RimI-like enzyme